MKKLIVGIACAAVVGGVAFGQGSVNWTGPSAAAFTAQTNTTVYSSYSKSLGGTATSGGTVGSTIGSSASGTGGYYFELLIGSAWNGSGEAVPTTLAGFSSWTDSGLEASNNPTSAGRFVAENANNGTALNAMSSTVSNTIVMVGWSANLGSTWSAALANAEAGTWAGTALFGVSNEGWIQAFASGTIPGAVLFSGTQQSYGTPINSLNTQLEVLNAVPEPGTLALAALGGASLLLFRRKK